MQKIISKQEFETFITSLNKNPGEYTSEEFLEIGIKHKQLANSDKNWKQLTEKVGYPGASESYRSFVNRHLKETGELPMQDINAIQNDSEEFQALYKEKTQIRDVYNAYRLSLRQDARAQAFKDAVIKAINNLPKLDFNVNQLPINSINDTEAILMISDLHLGANCKNFYNTFNYEVAKKRLEKLTTDTINYCNLMHVSKLNIVNLGDLIHGNIHITNRIESDLNIIDQIMKAAELISNMLCQFSKLSNIVVTYRSCTDNHARATIDYHNNIERENFGRLIDWYIESRCENSNIAFIHDNIDESLGKFNLMNGKKIMFAHGHLDNTNKCIDALEGATKEFIDYVLLSHYHTSKEKSYNGSKLIVNGSIVGTEQYALSKRLFGPAEQKLLIFTEDNFVDININLQI